MESFPILFVCSMLVFVGARPNGTSYENIQDAVSNGLPWGEPQDPKSCATNVCQDFQKLCKNGGQCERTPECGARCRCLKQYTGPFCGVKITESITNGKVELLKTPTPDNSQTVTESAILMSTNTETSYSTRVTNSVNDSTTSVKNKRSVETTEDTLPMSSTNARIVPDKNYKVLKTWMSILDKLRTG